MTDTSVTTADLADTYGPELRVCDLQFRQFGGRDIFSGQVRTVSAARTTACSVTWSRPRRRRGPGRGRQRLAAHRAAGDLIAGAAEANGWAGLILHGAVRDSVALAGLALGVKALGTTPRKSAKSGAGAVDVLVTFGNVTFRPGDILHADDDGIVLLPPATQGP